MVGDFHRWESSLTYRAKRLMSRQLLEADPVQPPLDCQVFLITAA
jgi:hypothetical protein